MKVLITGGLGFVGGYLGSELKRRGWEVRILDAEVNNNERSENESREYVKADLNDYRAVSDAVRGVDLVIHLAAKHRFFGVSKSEYFRVNVEGTRTILRVAAANGIKNIIFFSSVSVYGDLPHPTDESNVTTPNTLYGKTKLEAENLMRKWTEEDLDRKVLVIRPTVIYGPGNRGNMFRLIRQIASGYFLPVGDGSKIKSIAYVENLVEATLFLLDKGYRGFEVYNYVDEPKLKFNEILALIHRLLGKPIPRMSLPLTPILVALSPIASLYELLGKTFFITTAIRKINKETNHRAQKIRDAGFQQRYSNEEGLSRMISWYKNGKAF